LEQIGRLVEPADLLHPSSVDADAIVAAKAHLQNCDVCSRLVQMHRELQARFANLRGQDPSEPTPACPSAEEIRGLVSGMIEYVRATAILDHAITCDSCSAALRDEIGDLSEPTDAENAVISKLETAQPAVQRNLANRLAHTRESELSQTRKAPTVLAPRTFKPRTWYWLTAAAAMLLAIGLSGTFFLLTKRNNVDQLLAKAYVERRSFELRLPAASPAPLRIERGGNGSVFSKPASLLEAEALIQRQLQKTPNDSRWLAAKGRSELLEWQYNEAIRSFRRALETNPELPDVHRDLATAYFESAQAEHQPSQYAEAIEQLGQALAKHSDDSISLFNRAIIYEQMFLYDSAAKDWDAYLKLDPAGPWSTEARRHLEQIKKKLDHHNRSEQKLNEDPFSALASFEKGLRVVSSAELTSTDEEYLDLASTKWLSGFANDLQAGQTISQSSYGRTLKGFAQLWEFRHGDPWLSDLLASSESPGFQEAARTLAAAITSSMEGNPSLSLRQASSAMHQFETIRNRAGVLRARLELVYSLQRSLEDEECLRTALQDETELNRLRYHWIASKLLLERAACAASTTRVDEAQHSVALSEKISTERHFGVLYLRGLSFDIDFAADKGDRDVAWSTGERGLKQFWDGIFPSIRGYALCASLGYVAEDSQQPWVALALWSDAVPLIEKTGNRSTEGLARYRLATQEMLLKRNIEAKQELAKTNYIFSSLPRTQAFLNYQLASETSLASVEFALGDRAAALKRLQEITSSVHKIDQYQTALQYYLTLGKLQSLNGDRQTAERNFRSAVAISQMGLENEANDADRLNWDQQTSHAYRALVALLLTDNGNQEQALKIWEWYRSIPFESRTPKLVKSQSSLAQIEADPPQPNELDMRTLTPSLAGATFLTYAQLDDALVFWVYDNRGITFRRVAASAEQVATVSKRFARLCADPNSDLSQLRADGGQLYDWLIAPAEQLLSPDRTLWIEPDGDLSFVPFEAVTNHQGVPLLARFSVAYRSRAAGRHRDAEPLINSHDTALIVSSSLPDPASNEPVPLPDARNEAEAVAARFLNHRVIFDDTRQPSMISASFQKATLFHFAGHYVTGSRHPQTALALILSGAANQQAQSSLKSHPTLSQCKLVVLSACSTGSAQRLGLFDPDGLVHPLLRSGARRIIATRWNIDSSATTRLMDYFYGELLKGRTAVEALRFASRAVASDSALSHPYYWAAFGVFARD